MWVPLKTRMVFGMPKSENIPIIVYNHKNVVGTPPFQDLPRPGLKTPAALY